MRKRVPEKIISQCHSGCPYYLWLDVNDRQITLCVWEEEIFDEQDDEACRNGEFPIWCPLGDV